MEWEWKTDELKADWTIIKWTIEQIDQCIYWGSYETSFPFSEGRCSCNKEIKGMGFFCVCLHWPFYRWVIVFAKCRWTVVGSWTYLVLLLKGSELTLKVMFVFGACNIMKTRWHLIHRRLRQNRNPQWIGQGLMILIMDGLMQIHSIQLLHVHVPLFPLIAPSLRDDVAPVCCKEWGWVESNSCEWRIDSLQHF